MNTPINPTGKPGSVHHPLMIAAAIAIIVFCLAGTAAIMGWIPSSIGAGSSPALNANAATAPRGDLTEADRLALASKMQAPAPSQQLMAQPLAPSEAPVQQPSNYAPAPRPVQQNTNYVPETQPPVQREAAYRPVQVAAAAPAKNWCSNCGNVESVREIHQRAQGSGVGAAGGAILGGLLGNQVGSGNGRSLATVAGAVGGAVVGNQVEGNMKATTSYEIRVRMDDGSARTFHQQRAPGWRQGARVRVVKGVLHSVR
jgi:outer membrane lipoprotein SlyB